LPGCPEVDAQLCRSIIIDLYEWIERREFAEEDCFDVGRRLEVVARSSN
jgi:hypothetical protein